MFNFFVVPTCVFVDDAFMLCMVNEHREMCFYKSISQIRKVFFESVRCVCTSLASDVSI